VKLVIESTFAGPFDGGGGTPFEASAKVSLDYPVKGLMPGGLLDGETPGIFETGALVFEEGPHPAAAELRALKTALEQVDSALGESPLLVPSVDAPSVDASASPNDAGAVVETLEEGSPPPAQTASAPGDPVDAIRSVLLAPEPYPRAVKTAILEAAQKMVGAVVGIEADDEALLRYRFATDDAGTAARLGRAMASAMSEPEIP
jgi:hypothetical protein